MSQAIARTVELEKKSMRAVRRILLVKELIVGVRVGRLLKELEIWVANQT